MSDEQKQAEKSVKRVMKFGEFLKDYEQVLVRIDDVEFVGRRLTAKESDQVRQLSNSVLPPIRKTANGDELDYGNKEYIEADNKARRMAEAVTIYLGFRDLFDKQDCGTPEEMLAVVEVLPGGFRDSLRNALEGSIAREVSYQRFFSSGTSRLN